MFVDLGESMEPWKDGKKRKKDGRKNANGRKHKNIDLFGDWQKSLLGVLKKI